MLFDRVISGKSAAGVQAEQLLQLDYFRTTVQEEEIAPPSSVLQQQRTIPIPEPTPIPEPVVPDLNKPMEIGVFDVNDIM